MSTPANAPGGAGPAAPTAGLRLDPVEDALAAIAAGRPVVVVDDEDRENEGDLILAASAATEELIGFAVRHSSGLLCAPMSAARADALELPLMVRQNADPLRTAYTVSVDAAVGGTTGISAADRARTLRVLAGEDTVPADLVRPGHVLPLRAKPGGVLERRGHTEAAVDLTRLAGLPAVGMIVELVHDAGDMMRGPALREFADRHGLPMISIEALAVHRRRHDPPALAFTAPVPLPTEHGTFQALAVREGTAEHLVLVRGDVTTAEPVLTRVHSECVTGDVFGSRRCDCGPQLQESLARIDAAGRGVLILLRGHEGRGIGLVEKLRAYALQDAGRDTVEANLDLGLPVDARSFAAVPGILAHLSVGAVDLLTHNPEKAHALVGGGVEVAATSPLTPHPTPENLGYLTTKRDRLGHRLVGLPHTPAPTPTNGDPS
ncbi:3,4-dihydroxy-2-butanone-4-phosphate synthase [Brachybacterium saurashtrense]|uniref:GTP cyclohydrolase-2 n=1 Tax=Brachybacterium saurashtrense TaxID=556288 RepID=A0A345YRQ8_9MICO|nr:3,4-dihydroxy-2-butanone-4-phosphate synthase [Brachybacterium saurashtrense]AXK46610.1 3,4-dihydroxy-2-butanone-4-phosphate synthase [Brachybacterium saurashtrense]RRR20762.1 3,4-dihydroxy-2-butanone-4-phosphate synthase [Brachybacterium saurashtrense]RRR24351.1 3,4-dihydroxy-2-butanone-4-phosphate synthase [Brachybacterium saurashtrense]